MLKLSINFHFKNNLAFFLLFCRKAERSLYAVSAVTVIFIIIEFLGGYFANSLAIMTDAGHMVSDLLSFCVAIVAIKLAQRKPTKRLPFGYYRAEILGALIRYYALMKLLINIKKHN